MIGSQGHSFLLCVAAITIGIGLWQWDKVLKVLGFFVLGHLLTFSAALFGVMTVDAGSTALYTGLAALLSAVYLAFRSQWSDPTTVKGFFYFIALILGMVFGLDFQNAIGLPVDEVTGEVVSGYGFLVGLELAQLLLVLAVLFVNMVVEHIIDVKKSNWMLFSAGFISSLALILIFDN